MDKQVSYKTGLIAAAMLFIFGIGSASHVFAAESPAVDLVSVDRVFIKQIVFQGNTVISTEELAAASEPYTGREVSFEELQELRQKLTLLYVNRGFINSGVIIPDQKVRGDEVIFRVVEGRLTKIVIEGTGRLHENYISDRLAPYAKEPLNITDLQKGLQLLQQNPRINNIHAELGPDAAAGDSTLKVRVTEERPFSLSLEANNDNSPSIGSYGATLRFSHNNLSGRGDTLSGSLGITFQSALIDGDVSYAVPLSAADTLLRFNFRKNETTVIEEPFKDLDIISRNTTLGVSLLHPFYRTPAAEFQAGITMEYRKSLTFLLGRPYNFTEGTEDGTAQETVLRFFQEWTSRSQQQVIALRSTFSAGIDAFGATVREAGPDGRFFSWTGQFQWLRRIAEKGVQAFFRADMQFASESLLAVEKFSIGGMNSVRGYRKDLFVRDNGIASSIEIRVPVVRTEKRDDILQFVPFFDYGRSWNSGLSGQADNIASAGAGVRWAISENVFFQFFWGAALKSVTVPQKDPQDRGFHFSLTARLI